MKKDEYEPLRKTHPKLKGIYIKFEDLKKNVFSAENLLCKNPPIKSSNLIFFDDYNSTYIKLHIEIIRKFSLYKLIKSYNNSSMFIETVKKKKNVYYVNLAREILYYDDEAMIKFFRTKTKEPESILKLIFNSIHNIKNYISNYTVESFYYRYINLFLRTGDFNSFRLISNHISKFIYHLLEYRKTINQNGTSTLYRSMHITPQECKTYLNSIGRVICYPSFTSTSSKNDAFCPFVFDLNTIPVKLIIQQNNCKSIISIRDLSEHPSEEEYLCLPFTFFKITNVELKVNSFTIYMTALNSPKPIEEMFLEFMENENDNLDPEGLDMLRLANNDTFLYLNPSVYSKNYQTI